MQVWARQAAGDLAAALAACPECQWRNLHWFLLTDDDHFVLCDAHYDAYEAIRLASPQENPA